MEKVIEKVIKQKVHCCDICGKELKYGCEPLTISLSKIMRNRYSLDNDCYILFEMPGEYCDECQEKMRAKIMKQTSECFVMTPRYIHHDGYGNYGNVDEYPKPDVNNLMLQSYLGSIRKLIGVKNEAS